MFQNSTNQHTSGSSMLFEFEHMELFPLTISDLLGNLLTAIVCGLTISFVYRLTHKNCYTPSFVNSLIILPIITAVVILLIGNNVARAFGLVGAMSIIRFRTALRDTQDIIFIFFALAVGMAAGVGLDVLAIVTTMVISLVIYFVVNLSPNKLNTEGYMVCVRYPAELENETNLRTLFSTYCSHVKLLSHKKLEDLVDVVTEAVYLVKIAEGRTSTQLIQQIDSLMINCQVVLKMVDENGKVIKEANTTISTNKLEKKTPV